MERKTSNKEKKYKGKYKGLTRGLIDKVKRWFKERKHRASIRRLEKLHRKLSESEGWW